MTHILLWRWGYSYRAKKMKALLCGCFYFPSRVRAALQLKAGGSAERKCYTGYKAGKQIGQNVNKIIRQMIGSQNIYKQRNAIINSMFQKDDCGNVNDGVETS